MTKAKTAKRTVSKPTAKIEVYRSNDYEQNQAWRWRLRHNNGRIMAEGGEGYSNKTKAHRAIARVKILIVEAPVVAGH